MLAVALLDGQVLPEQYILIAFANQMCKVCPGVFILPNSTFTSLFPEQMKCSVKITLMDGTTFQYKKLIMKGFTPSFSWETLVNKFINLTIPFISLKSQENLIDTVEHLDILTVKDLTKLFSSITKEPLP